jgi:sulfonate transport system substrate-binding protein
MQRVPYILAAAATGLIAGLLAAQTATADLPMRIGLSMQPSNALVMVALDRRYFSDEGLDVSVTKYSSGTRALRQGLFTGKADLTTASDVPLVLSRFERQDVSIVATIFEAEDQNRIIARPGITIPADLKGKRIATQRGSAVHYFLHLFLLEHRLSEEAVDMSFMRAGLLPEALARGDIDAFSMREPYISEARDLLDGNAGLFSAPGLYSQSDQVAMTNDYLDRNPGSAEKVLRALIRAEQFVSESPSTGQRIVARFLGVNSGQIAAIWPEFSPRVTTEQPPLPRLEQIGRWAVRRQLVTSRHIPNFLKLIRLGPLQTVRPRSITVVR